MPITTPGEDACRKHAEDRDDGDPEVEPGHPVEAAQLRDVDHPEHDRVDDDGRQDRLRQLREQRRQHDQGREHEATRDERGHRCARPRRLVQRARREAGRHRHSLEHAGADVRHPLRHRLLVDVDAVPMPGRERPGVTGRLREADQQQGRRRDHDHGEVVPDDVVVRQHRRGEPARDVSDDRDAVGAQVEDRRREQAADDQHERPRDRRGR